MQEFRYPFDLPVDYHNVGKLSNKNDKDKEVPLLFQPLVIKDIELKNRLVVSPMCQYSAVDGLTSDYHLIHYTTLAKGGPSLVFIEATSITPEGRISPNDLGLWNDDQIIPLRRVVNSVHNYNAKVGIQIGHAGRKASTAPMFLPNSRNTLSQEQGGWEIVGASAIPYNEATSGVPRELSTQEVRDLIKSFGQSARRAYEAGIDVIEIHGAHGYLISEFLSPLSNQRTDEFGGSFENRIRFLLEVISEVRLHWPINKPLFLRISATEWVENGWNLEDSIRLTKIIQEEGLVDLIDVSTGGNNSKQQIKAYPSYQVPFSDEIKSKNQIKTSTVGLITSGKQAESILQEDKADLIMIGRQFLRDPYFAIHAAQEFGMDLEVPIQYTAAKQR